MTTRRIPAALRAGHSPRSHAAASKSVSVNSGAAGAVGATESAAAECPPRDSPYDRSTRVIVSRNGGPPCRATPVRLLSGFDIDSLGFLPRLSAVEPPGCLGRRIVRRLASYAGRKIRLKCGQTPETGGRNQSRPGGTPMKFRINSALPMATAVALMAGALGAAKAEDTVKI